MIRFEIIPRINDLFSDTMATRNLLSTICRGVLCGNCGGTGARFSESVSVVHCLSNHCHPKNEVVPVENAVERDIVLSRHIIK